MGNLTCKTLKSFVKEEKAAAKQYAELGFPKLARDEASHAMFFKNKLNKRCK